MTKAILFVIAVLCAGLNTEAQDDWGCRRETRRYTRYDVTRYQHGSHSHEVWTPRETWYETRTYCRPDRIHQPHYGFEPWIQPMRRR